MLNIKTIARQVLVALGVVGMLAFAAGTASAAQQPVSGGPAVSAPAQARVAHKHGRHAHRHGHRHGHRHHRHHAAR